MPEPGDERLRARDRALRRLRRLTLTLSAAAAALTGVFAGLGATSAPGHAAGASTRAATLPVRHVEAAAPTPALPAESAPSTAAPAPAPAPAPASAPPVVVSGGS